MGARARSFELAGQEVDRFVCFRRVNLIEMAFGIDLIKDVEGIESLVRERET